MDFYPGIDIGTSRVKAVLFDEHFQACASVAQNTGPRPHGLTGGGGDFWPGQPSPGAVESWRYARRG